MKKYECLELELLSREVLKNVIGGTSMSPWREKSYLEEHGLYQI
nr:hypothetical protein [uncultured Bacteroides sp.]